MKRVLVIFFVFTMISGLAVQAQTTTIWVVRHAEKDVSNPQNADPDLSPAGVQRSNDLAKYLMKNKPAAIYSTNYKRTLQTADPLAKQAEIKTVTYDPRAMKALPASILGQFQGKEIVVVGHSNTVLEMVEAFGGTRPVAALSDEDYDYIFKVSIPKEGKVITESFQYGMKHRDVKGTGNTMN